MKENQQRGNLKKDIGNKEEKEGEKEEGEEEELSHVGREDGESDKKREQFIFPKL